MKLTRRSYLSTLLISALAIPFTTLSAETMHAATLNDIHNENRGWMFLPAINGGYNKLLDGYDKYKDLGNLGLDLYIQPPPAEAGDDLVNWRDHIIFRFSADWFPLQVPEGNNGLKEDIYSFNGGLIYAFNMHPDNFSSWRPFVGGGIGVYRDEISLDTPATGKIKSGDNHLGYNASIGILMPTSKSRFPLRLIPEIRYHRIKYVDKSSSNMTYQLGLAYWPEWKPKK